MLDYFEEKEEEEQQQEASCIMKLFHSIKDTNGH